MQAEEITDMERLRLWIARHEATSSAKWEAQEKSNTRFEHHVRNLIVADDTVTKRVESAEKRIDRHERRLAFLCGIAAGGGGIVGSLVPKLFSTIAVIL